MPRVRTRPRAWLGAGAPAPAAALPVVGTGPGVMADAAAAVDHAQLDAGQHVVHIASKYIGKPYVWGGESPNSGFDCSGLVQYSYRQLGVDLPRTTFDQIKVGQPSSGASSSPAT